MCDIRLLKHGWGHRGHTFDERIAYKLASSICRVVDAPAEVGKVHYDFGNDLFALMLDITLCCSCGYWKGLATK